MAAPAMMLDIMGRMGITSWGEYGRLEGIYTGNEQVTSNNEQVLWIC